MSEPSEALAEFIRWFPEERSTIYAFVRGAAASLRRGAVVYDIGAGDAPYRELFDHCDYRTVDWEQSVHASARLATVVSSADDLAIDDESADAALLTQVLEHIADPAAALREVHRILRPGGRLFATVPFAWELHEIPHDYWRFTPWSLERLAAGAGFVETTIEPRNDCLATLAQLLKIAPGTLGRADDGLDAERDRVSERLRAMGDELAALAGKGLDVRNILPLGWTISTQRLSGAEPHRRGAWRRARNS